MKRDLSVRPSRLERGRAKGHDPGANEFDREPDRLVPSEPLAEKRKGEDGRDKRSEGGSHRDNCQRGDSKCFNEQDVCGDIKGARERYQSLGWSSGRNRHAPHHGEHQHYRENSSAGSDHSPQRRLLGSVVDDDA